MAEIRVTEHAEQPTAIIRESVRMDALPEFFGSAFSALAEAVGTAAAGPFFAKYHGMPTDVADVEAGVPVAGHFEASGSVQPGTLPAGRVYEAVHVGPYETLESTYREIGDRMAADGAVPSDEMWEYYITDPEAEPDPATWVTRVCWPVRR